MKSDEFEKNKHHEREPLPLMHSMVFAKMFENKQSAEALKGLINVVLRDVGLPEVSEIVEVKSEYPLLGEVIEAAQTPRGIKFSHGGRVDIRAKAGDGRLFSIEVQVDKDPFMNERTLFYDWLVVRDDFPTGKGYDELPTTIMINFMKHGLRREPGIYHNVIGMVYLSGPGQTIASDRFQLHNIELDVFEELHGETATEDLPELGLWLRYMTDGYRNGGEEQKMINMDRELEEFAKRYHYAADDPKLRQKYEFIVKNQRSVQTQLNLARKEGKEEGREEGWETGISAGAEALAAMCREFGLTREESVRRLITTLGISQREAENYVGPSK